MAAISCRLYIDGHQVADTAADVHAGELTALDDLRITWGRSTTIDQPDTASASFTLLNPAGNGFRDDVYAGARIDIDAWADIAPPAGTNIVEDASFEAGAGGLVTGVRVYQTTSPAGFYNAAGAKNPARDLAIQVAPGAVNDTPGAWDHIPTTGPDQPWTLRAWIRAYPDLAIDIRQVLYTSPTGETAQTGTIDTYIAPDTDWHLIERTFETPSVSGMTWLGVAFVAEDAIPWADVIGTWADQTTTWSYWNVQVDDVGLLIAADVVAGRTARMFTGRITDLEASQDDDGGRVALDITAVEFLADLANVYIGDEPWPVEPVQDRTERILALAGGDYPARIDAPAQTPLLSWRDVDRRSSVELLTDVAISADAILWGATHLGTGDYLWLESVSLRGAASYLAEVDGTVVIKVGTIAGTRVPAVQLSACDVLADPVIWVQDVGDVITRTDVTWLEQTVDDDGRPAPTERHVSSVDLSAESRHGQRRLGVSTELADELSAASIASAILARSRVADWRMAGLQWDTAITPPDTAADTSRLLDLLDGTLRIGRAIILSELPAWSPVGDTIGVYLEGGTCTYTGGAWTLDMTVSPSAAFGSSVPWADLDPAWAWREMDKTISWLDLYGVAGSAETFADLLTNPVMWR